MRLQKTVEIGKDIYWVGGTAHSSSLHCNPYLIIDGEEAVLIDPGSVLDFEYVYENVCSLVPLHQIKYVILHHQDPDFCSSVPLFEQKGAQFQVVTHWRTQTLVKYYGIKSPYYLVNEKGFQLSLKSGRVLSFVQTPYLHFPGAIATYDLSSKILFSSDLFGAISYDWSLYADEHYIGKMKTFHEHYMPSNDILRPVMEMLLHMDISIIAPQHGSIIIEDVKKYIRVLRDLECGTFMSSVLKELSQDGGYRFICSIILKRLASVYSKEALLEAIQGLNLTLDKETLDILDYEYSGDKLWNLIFEQLLVQKGIEWLIIIEPLVKKLSKKYDIKMPEIYETALGRVEQQVLSMSKENSLLREANDRLKSSMKEAQEKLMKCPVTGLYNYDFFKGYLIAELRRIEERHQEDNPILVVFNVDNLAKMRFSYGDSEVDESLRTIAYIINSVKEEDTLTFRLQGAAFACYIPHAEREAALSFAERIRNEIAMSEKFIERLTVSAGLVSYDELESKGYLDSAESLYNIAMMRVKLAKSRGMNFVCSSSEVDKYQQELGKILLADTDLINLDVLKTFLENLNYAVFTAENGEEILKVTEREEIDLIISEIMLPKMDGFLAREKLLSQSATKNIPFIIVSYLKNEDSVKRAAALGITNYFKKPYLLSELLGLIKNRVKEGAYR